MARKKEKLGRVVLIHGVRLKSKEKNELKRLAPAFREAGFSVIVPSYGYMPAFLVGLFQWLDNRIADSMASFICENDILLGHSNGGTLVYLISQQVRLRGAILVNAALEVNDVPNAQFVHVYYNNGDIVAKLSSIIPFHPWGEMGGVGYQGNDPRVLNIDQANPPHPDLPSLDGHSDIFNPGKTTPWAKYMANLAFQAVLHLLHVKSHNEKNCEAV